MNSLLLRLSAGQPPNKQELENTADYLRKKAMEEQGFGGDGESPKGGAGRPGPGSSGPGAGDSAAMPERKGPASTQAYWAALKDKAQDDATMLTCIDKARNIFCYANIRGGRDSSPSPNNPESLGRQKGGESSGPHDHGHQH